MAVTCEEPYCQNSCLLVTSSNGMSLSFYDHRQHQMIINNWNGEIFQQLGSEEGVSGKILSDLIPEDLEDPGYQLITDDIILA